MAQESHSVVHTHMSGIPCTLSKGYSCYTLRCLGFHNSFSKGCLCYTLACLGFHVLYTLHSHVWVSMYGRELILYAVPSQNQHSSQ